MNIKIRELTKAETLAESAAVIAKQQAMMADWQKRRDAATVEIFNKLLPQ